MKTYTRRKPTKGVKKSKPKRISRMTPKEVFDKYWRPEGLGGSMILTEEEFKQILKEVCG